MEIVFSVMLYMYIPCLENDTALACY